ncbi:MAG: hypothetical protein M3619_02505 [Myxococcota bacterium]|nr:hypothetical protein [Myxococcota bacterium]
MFEPLPKLGRDVHFARDSLALRDADRVPVQVDVFLPPKLRQLATSRRCERDQHAEEHPLGSTRLGLGGGLGRGVGCHRHHEMIAQPHELVGREERTARFVGCLEPRHDRGDLAVEHDRRALLRSLEGTAQGHQLFVDGVLVRSFLVPRRDVAQH